LGAPGAIVGSGAFASVFSPFNAHYETTDLVKITEGGSLTLRLDHFVSIQANTREIGIWENVFLIDTSSDGSGKTGNPASAFGAGSARVQVSENGTDWYALNNDQPIVFGLPGNYYTNSSGPFDPAPPANPAYADFGKPFTGQLSDFNGKDYPGVLGVLDGSAGGTWLDLDGAPFTQVGFIRFIGVQGSTMELDAVAINTSAAGAAVPEPAAGMALLCGGGLLSLIRRRRA
jgi:hypothetical protein